MRPSLSSVDHMVSCIRVTPKKVPDAGIFGADPYAPLGEYRLTVFPQDLLVSGKWYSATDIGADSALKISSGLAPGTIELEAPYGVGGITRLLLQLNYFRGATCRVFNTCWNDPVEDEQPSGIFIWGKTNLYDNGFKVELTHMADLLKQDSHMRYSKLCSNFFCDLGDDWVQKYRPAGFCGLNPNDYTVTGTITDVTSPVIIADLTSPEADGYFDNGMITFCDDTGMHGVDQTSYEILSYVGGVFTLAEPIRCYSFLVEGATTYKAIAGCKKRRTEDCVGKYSNGVRFNGFNDIPIKSEVYKLGGFK